ncbi:hypothetical protein [Raoultella planticola]|uniref:hypothetical protein n=1 Tax=Raoultella planticola TaxID=575 RepID=UPI001682F220|nr:hypothetical protein [Raoultella planticola]
MANETEFKFGDYAIIEQKRHGVPSEMFVHKVIGIRRSNSWVDVPVQSPATETLHCGMEVVCLCICCGIDETKVRQYRVKDMQRSSRSPDSELTAALATIEKCREVSGCPAGVALQDWLRQLAAERIHVRARHLFIRALAVSILEHSGGRHDWRGAMEDASDLVKAVDEVYSQSRLTDRSIAVFKADAIDEAAVELERIDTVASTRAIAFKLREFSKQLREGAENEQVA